MTEMQQLLYDLYFEAWRSRHAACEHVNAALGELERQRGERDDSQKDLERIHRLAKKYGIGGLLSLAWPLEMPEEEAQHTGHATAEVK